MRESVVPKQPCSVGRLRQAFAQLRGVARPQVRGRCHRSGVLLDGAKPQAHRSGTRDLESLVDGREALRLVTPATDREGQELATDRRVGFQAHEGRGHDVRLAVVHGLDFLGIQVPEPSGREHQRTFRRHSIGDLVQAQQHLRRNLITELFARAHHLGDGHGVNVGVGTFERLDSGRRLDHRTHALAPVMTGARKSGDAEGWVTTPTDADCAYTGEPGTCGARP